VYNGTPIMVGPACQVNVNGTSVTCGAKLGSSCPSGKNCRMHVVSGLDHCDCQ
jgi:hypothetical protein